MPKQIFNYKTGMAAAIPWPIVARRLSSIQRSTLTQMPGKTTIKGFAKGITSQASTTKSINNNTKCEKTIKIQKTFPGVVGVVSTENQLREIFKANDTNNQGESIRFSLAPSTQTNEPKRYNTKTKSRTKYSLSKERNKLPPVS